HLYGALATLKIGMDILFEKEKVQLEQIVGHGGLFKTPVVGQQMMAATGIPVAVMETAGEGGAWGIALLASFMLRKKENEELGTYLQNNVFASMPVMNMNPKDADVIGFNAFIQRYKKAVAIEKTASEVL
ncbi:MAG: FGGY-family carbohydrate kinase, partial [Treponemataceae bacterium]